MGLFDWLKADKGDDEYLATTMAWGPEDELARAFEGGLLTRWDVPWDKSDEEKDATLLGILDERQEEG